MKELPLEYSERMKILLGNDFDKYLALAENPDIRYSLTAATREQRNQAMELSKQGKTAEEIYLETGAYLGADGRWKTEIDDSKSEIIIDDKDLHAKSYKLSDILKHDKLYKAYPELKDVEVQV